MLIKDLWHKRLLLGGIGENKRIVYRVMKRILAGTITLLLFSVTSYGSGIFSCIGSNGKTIFTDKKRLCISNGTNGTDEIKNIETSDTNLHSQFGASISEEYYNYSFRAYEELHGYKIVILAEKKLVDNDPDLLDLAARRLEDSTTKALNLLPHHTRQELDSVKYYIFSGSESKTGGRKGGQWYFRKGNTISARFDNSIVVRSAKDYLAYNPDYALQVAVHELSHAYYWYHRKRLYLPVKNAFDNAIKNQLYTGVKHRNGGTVKKAYAVKNKREYFAELSKIYHLSNSYFPFSASDLQQYDPQGYKAIQSAFVNIRTLRIESQY